MIGVSKKNLRAGGRHLVDRESLDRPLRADRHERGGLHHSMRQKKLTAARGRGWIALQEVEGERGRSCHGGILREFRS